ncbi:acyl-CoA Delta-6 desaturase-like [Ruditapes philippinarum]|uniref:acyl-CoA Delta-6 desaturase-like n=1 Tax=Ruditapes philippinarum TaxID=129788 RepID=UPI00295AFCC6|nr:acyl-CoA Delta-6 desaturase-like [Ruditapes philippinarum]XP_060574259.1 acyl-CoA Delta-6 desaturase-like [Ruditapes philippinarum]XP_060574260.1 acyl-CoA Delta-6 desaturase-like [Ruditapes philippinarum]WDP79931.1 delta 5 fatty acyl desaturase [Ruditapes philippinarum]
MGRGGEKREKLGAGQVIPWSEIQKHSSRDDRWIVISGQVYDVTEWSKKHPGGQRLIGHYAGQDATEAFGAFHNNLEHVKKFLKPIHVGPVESYVDHEMNKDFRKLKETAIKMKLFEPSYLFFSVTLAHILILQVLAYMVFLWYGVHLWTVVASLIMYATAQTQAGWLHHDFGHLSVFKTSKANHYFHHFILTFFKGCSSSWWNNLHYQHHAKPNVMDKDPDVRLDKLFVVGDVMPVQVAKEGKASMPFNLQHKYFFAIGPPLLFPVYFQIMLFRFQITRRLWKELSICLMYYLIHFYLHIPLLGVGGAIAHYFTMRCMESHWFTWVSQSNHIPMTIKTDEASPWLQLQLNATCDIEKSFFNDWFTGHLNFQIEHHLFPTMPRHNLYKIAPLVKSLCEKHDVPYIVKPLWQSFADIVKSLRSSGELWQETYNEFHCK